MQGDRTGYASKGRLVAVVVTHNRLGQLQVTLDHLLLSPRRELAGVVVVDNASTDGTAAWLARHADNRVHVLRHARNRGGAGGFEAGLRLAMDWLAADWAVVMDDDARPMPGALSRFHALPCASWDAVAAAVYQPDGQICEMNRPSRNPFWDVRLFGRTMLRGRAGFHIPSEAFEGAQMAVDVASFVGLFLSRRAVELAGYPDGRLFLYGDDSLYTLRLRRAGGRICFAPNLRFEHDLSTFGGPKGGFRPIWKAYYYHRNLLMLYRLAAGWLFWPVLAVVLPRWLRRRRAHLGQEAVFARLLKCAIRDGLRGKVTRPHAEVLRMAAAQPSDDRVDGLDPAARVRPKRLTYPLHSAAVVGSVQEQAKDFIGPRAGPAKPKAASHSGGVMPPVEGGQRQKVVQKQT